ncbi:hypothetical protein ACFL3T_00505 [Patescibacteria group bacterium]
MLAERHKANPILKPDNNHSWEAEATFNGCPVKKGNKTYLVYRAISLPHYHKLAGAMLKVSNIGIAESKDGINFVKRKRFITPEHSWEKFGCEDPRITKLEDKYYIFYTALSTYPFSAEGIKVGVAITKDLKTIEEKHLVTPFNAKGMALFPEKINGKIWSILTVHTDSPPSEICLASFDKEEDMWSESVWNKWHNNFNDYSLPLVRRPQDHVEVGAPPIKTENGWLVIYSYIQNYFSNNPVFGVEAVLLDLENPLKIIAKTTEPFLTPQEYYEKIGIVPNIVFPTGVLLDKNKLKLYYGGADTTCCIATIDKQALLSKLLKKEKSVNLIRGENNPIITPNKDNPWESKATFNPAAIYLNDKVHLVYRAMSEDNTSVMGYATSSDGLNIDYRSKNPIYTPQEAFEQKKVSGGNSGCEDPRLTQIGNIIYMVYTAYDGVNLPRVALTSISVKDFIDQKWNWAKPVLITPPDLDDKDACLFPEKINGKHIIIHRFGDDMDLAFPPNLDFDGQTWIDEYRWLSPRAGMWDSKKVGVAAPPIKTKKGWILFYHGVSDDSYYRLGAVLLDLKDPTIFIARSDEPIFEPEMEYEKEGIVPNVVFPCGAVLIDKKIFVYYGGADKVVGVATVELKKLLKHLETNKC